MRTKEKAVHGVLAPGTRLTIWALGYVLFYVALPVMGAALFLEGALYAVLAAAGRCNGILCLF